MSEERCADCRFWPLSGYVQARWDAGEPIDHFSGGGAGGPSCDGSASECRRHAPAAIDPTPDRHLHGDRKFPTTRAGDWCGDFEPRTRPSAATQSPPAASSITVGELEISQRAHTVLRCAGLTTLGQIAAMTRPRMRRAENCGAVTLAELDAVLTKHGIWWNPFPPHPVKGA